MFLQLYYSCICLRDGFEMVPKYLQNEISGITAIQKELLLFKYILVYEFYGFMS